VKEKGEFFRVPRCKFLYRLFFIYFFVYVRSSHSALISRSSFSTQRHKLWQSGDKNWHLQNRYTRDTIKFRLNGPVFVFCAGWVTTTGADKDWKYVRIWKGCSSYTSLHRTSTLFPFKWINHRATNSVQKSVRTGSFDSLCNKFYSDYRSVH